MMSPRGWAKQVKSGSAARLAQSMQYVCVVLRSSLQERGTIVDETCSQVPQSTQRTQDCLLLPLCCFSRPPNLTNPALRNAPLACRL